MSIENSIVSRRTHGTCHSILAHQRHRVLGAPLIFQPGFFRVFPTFLSTAFVTLFITDLPKCFLRRCPIHGNKHHFFRNSGNNRPAVIITVLQSHLWYLTASPP